MLIPKIRHENIEKPWKCRKKLFPSTVQIVFTVKIRSYVNFGLDLDLKKHWQTVFILFVLQIEWNINRSYNFKW